MSVAVGRLSKGKRSVGDVGKREKAAARKSVTRTTLINPQGISWPDPPEVDAVELLETIERSIKCMKGPSRKVPRDVVKNVPKSDRGAARKEWNTQNAIQFGFNVANYLSYRTSLSLGVNCISRALELELLAAVVIEKNVNPDVITKMLVPLAVNKGVPILSVSGLSKVFEGVLDIRCLACGLKEECATDVSNHFFPLCNLIKEVYVKHFMVTEDLDVTIDIKSLTPPGTCTTGSDTDRVKRDNTESLKSTEEIDKSGSVADTDLLTVANTTDEPLPKRCRRLSLTVDEEMADIEEAGLSSRQSQQTNKQPSSKKSSASGKSNAKPAKKSFVPAKVRKVKLN